MPAQVRLGQGRLQHVFRAVLVADDEVPRTRKRRTAVMQKGGESELGSRAGHRRQRTPCTAGREIILGAVNQTGVSPHHRCMTLKSARLLALAAAPLTLTVVACSSNGSDASTLTTPSPNPVVTTQAPTPVDTACAAVPADAAAKPPSAVPTPTDATFYEKLK